MYNQLSRCFKRTGSDHSLCTILSAVVICLFMCRFKFSIHLILRSHTVQMMELNFLQTVCLTPPLKRVRNLKIMVSQNSFYLQHYLTLVFQVQK